MQPSNIVVTDRKTLSDNFSENAGRFLCDVTLGTGAYAVGGQLLGLVKLAPPARLITAGAVLTALALCPSSADEGALYGAPPPFSGGQCPVVYDFTYVKSDDVITPAQGRIDANVLGPIQSVEVTFEEGIPDRNLKRFTARIVGAQGLVVFTDFAFTAAFGTCSIALVRNDNLPDDCGSFGGQGGQIITNVNNGDTIDNSKVVDSRDQKVIVPVFFNVGGINNSLNFEFGDLVIESLLPLSFNVDIGGSRFGFEEGDDGKLKPKKTNPDKDGAANKIEELLKEIKECVCKPDVDLDMLFLPVVDASVSCDIKALNFLVPKGSVSPSQERVIEETAQLAREACKRRNVEQLPEKQIFAATVVTGGAEVFTGEIDVDVVSLRVKIDGFDENILPKITLYPDSNQRKFGSVAFVTDSVQGGGDYIYVFDSDTYVSLPKRGKKGKLRILFKAGTSFSVFDTGERI